MRLGNHLLQYRLGVADDGDGNGIVLADIRFIDGNLNDLFACGNWRNKDGFGEAGSDAKHQVRLLQEMIDHFRPRETIGCTKRQRVVFGKGAFAVQCAHDGHLNEFGEFEKLVPGFSV